MNICLVTGGAGFIGSHIVEKLVERGDSVRVLDNFSSGKTENLENVEDQIKIITGDLRNEKDLENAVNGIDLIYHQAAFVSVPLSLEDPDQCTVAANVTAKCPRSERDFTGRCRNFPISRLSHRFTGLPDSPTGPSPGNQPDKRDGFRGSLFPCNGIAPTRRRYWDCRQ